jgi:hypothetical protein
MRFVAFCRSRPVLPWQIEFIPFFHQERNQSGFTSSCAIWVARFDGIWMNGLAPDCNWRSALGRDQNGTELAVNSLRRATLLVVPTSRFSP